jgi:hypothetical protein
MTALVWLLWGSLFAGGAATLLGVLAGLPNRAEIGTVREVAADGGPVDRVLAADLFGRQLVLGLPGAALFVLAAAAAVGLIAAVTSAQYGRVARLRETAAGGPSRPLAPGDARVAVPPGVVTRGDAVRAGAAAAGDGGTIGA